MDKRVDAILELIMSLARLDFSQKIEVSESGDQIDAIAAGVNMLGEELESKAISLQEKNQLLRELHHRVKNNMQIMMSMLNLQMSNEADERLRDIVEDCKGRINAMALVHEMLYSTDGFEYSELNDYIVHLSRSVLISFAPPENKISVNVSIAPSIYMDIDSLIPMGLIINEMLSNSLKHAFPSGEGKIEITGTTDGEFKLIYLDNGVGLPADFELETSETLGTQLIDLLVAQMEGKLRISSNNGVKFEMTFPNKFVRKQKKN